MPNLSCPATRTRVAARPYSPRQSGRRRTHRPYRALQRASLSLSALSRLRNGLSVGSAIRPYRRSRARTAGSSRLPLARQVLNFVFAHLLPFPRRLRLAFALLRLYQRTGLQRVVGMLLPKKLRAMDALLPNIPGKFFRAPKQLLPALGERRAKVAMLDGCVMPLLFGDVNDATVRVLRRNGCDVLFPKQQICCGALNTHNGESHRGETDGAAQHRCFSRSRTSTRLSSMPPAAARR